MKFYGGLMISVLSFFAGCFFIASIWPKPDDSRMPFFIIDKSGEEWTGSVPIPFCASDHNIKIPYPHAFHGNVTIECALDTPTR